MHTRAGNEARIVVVHLKHMKKTSRSALARQFGRSVDTLRKELRVADLRDHT